VNDRTKHDNNGIDSVSVENDNHSMVVFYNASKINAIATENSRLSATNYRPTSSRHIIM